MTQQLNLPFQKRAFRYKRRRQPKFGPDPRSESFFQERREKLKAWFKAGCPLPDDCKRID